MFIAVFIEQIHDSEGHKYTSSSTNTSSETDFVDVNDVFHGELDQFSVSPG